MLQRALGSGGPFDRVAEVEVYGSDCSLHLWLERRGVPHVMAINRSDELWALTDQGPMQVRADRLMPPVDGPGWDRCSSGDRTKGPRIDNWATLNILHLREPVKGYRLVRRSLAKSGDLSY